MRRNKPEPIVEMFEYAFQGMFGETPHLKDERFIRALAAMMAATYQTAYKNGYEDAQNGRPADLENPWGIIPIDK